MGKRQKHTLKTFHLTTAMCPEATVRCVGSYSATFMHYRITKLMDIKFT